MVSLVKYIYNPSNAVSQVYQYCYSPIFHNHIDLQEQLIGQTVLTKYRQID